MSRFKNRKKYNKSYVHNYIELQELKEILHLQGIYKLSFNGSFNFYVGSTTETFKTRFRRHIYELKTGKRANKMLLGAYKKYGNPVFSILEICSKEECIKKEQYYIDKLNPKYNICKSASSTLGVVS